MVDVLKMDIAISRTDLFASSRRFTKELVQAGNIMNKCFGKLKHTASYTKTKDTISPIIGHIITRITIHITTHFILRFSIDKLWRI